MCLMDYLLLATRVMLHVSCQVFFAHAWSLLRIPKYVGSVFGLYAHLGISSLSC